MNVACLAQESRLDSMHLSNKILKYLFFKNYSKYALVFFFKDCKMNIIDMIYSSYIGFCLDKEDIMMLMLEYLCVK